MKKLIAAALAAAVIVPMAAPVAAEAQRHRGDRGNDYGDRHFAERRQNWGDNDWRDYRNHDRASFRRGHWRAPFRYQRFRPGVRINGSYFDQRYVVSDPWRYRLPRAGYGQVWVRHYDDLLLVDTRRGTVIRVIDNFYW